MCIGASIVIGYTSPDGVGFREVFRNNLTSFGVPVNMVGAVRLGSMLDNDIEAYAGNRISQVFDQARSIVPQAQPNVFIINLGTNNVLQNIDVDDAGAQMEDFINYLLETSPRSFVVLSTLLVNTVPNMEPSILNVNAQYRDLMPVFQSAGKPVVLAEMHPSAGGADVPQVSDIGSDGSHPYEDGYDKMANILAQAVRAADSMGFIQVPIDNGTPNDGDAGRSISSTPASTTTTAASTSASSTNASSTTVLSTTFLTASSTASSTALATIST
jgi:lysophospholipase L1-like esterase